MIRSTKDHISLTTLEEILFSSQHCLYVAVNVEQTFEQNDIFDQKFVRPQELP